LQKDLNYGFVSALAVNSLNGFSELDTLALNHLEKDILNLNERFVPLQTASTQSNNEGGAPEKSDVQISDEGDKTRNKK
jgi:hypothetical protein